MALVTFKLSDMGIASMGNLAPRVFFVPEGAAVLPTTPNDYLLASKWVEATLGDDTVTFTVDLYPTSWMQPPRRYRLVIWWLDAAKNFRNQDTPPWLFTVPAEGGQLSDMVDVPLTNGFVWVWSDPGDPPGAKPGDWVFNPDTNDLDQIV